MNKQFIAVFLLLTLSISLLSGCKKEMPEDEAMSDQFIENQEEEIRGDEDAEGGEEEEEPAEQKEPQPSEKEESKEEKQEEDQPEEKPEEDQPEEKPQEDQPEEKPEEEQPEEKPQEEQPEEKPEGDSGEEQKDAEEPDEEKESTEGDQNTPSVEGELTNLYQSSVLSTAIAYTGKNTKNSNYTVSKGIEVTAGDSVTFGPMASAQVVMGYTYDKSGKPLEIINGHTAKETAVLMGGMKLFTYTVPADGASVKFSVHNDSKNDFVLTRNRAFDLKEYSTLSGILPDFVDDALKNKDGLFVGDSICIATRDERMDGVKGWARRIGDEYGMNAVNNGKSGVSVSNKRSQGTVLTQLLEKKTQDFDYVVLHGGVNDAWSKVDVGVMEEGFDPDAFDPATYAGGLELLIYNAIVHYGENASIGYLINFKAPSCEKGYVSDMTAYNEMGKKICEKWGITYFDMYNHEGITKELKMDTLTHTTDYIHPSSSGYDILSPYIADYMKTMLPCKQEILQKVLEEK